MKFSRCALASGVLIAGVLVLFLALRNRNDASLLSSEDPNRSGPVHAESRPLTKAATVTEEKPVEEGHRDNWERTFGEYSIGCSSTEQDGERLFQIKQRGRVVFSATDYQFTVGEKEKEYEKPEDAPCMVGLPEIGVDITGDGKPKLVVEGFSGGNHGTYTYYVFEIGDEFRLITKLEGSTGTFFDVDKDGAMEFRTYDDNYISLPGVCMANRPVPDVILRYKDGQYVMAPDLMATPATDAGELDRQAAGFNTGLQQVWAANGKLEGDSLAGLWSQMLELTYSGHEELARQLFDKSWPENVPGKVKALHQFAKAVARSEYWQQFAAAAQP